MKLRLQDPPTPENAAKHAQWAVEAACSIDHIKLDYSPQSLAEVDRIVGGFHAEGLRVDQIAETVFSLGCYVGEVLVRNHGGVWKMPADTAMPEQLKAHCNLMVVVWPDGSIWNPIGKTFKLLENGMCDSAAYWYRVTTKRRPRS
jgi:hypothetical protein